MLQPSPDSAGSGAERALADFCRGRSVLVIGGDAEQLRPTLERTDACVKFCASAAVLPSEHFDLAIWFYPSGQTGDEQAVNEIARHADEVLLLAAPGAPLAKRRPALVRAFHDGGFVPDYECAIAVDDPAALRLVRSPSHVADTFSPAAEAAFSRLNVRMTAVQRTLRTRMAELEAADRHIANLEEKLLKLKEAKRDLKQLRAEKLALRKSPERKVGQVLLAPYRLPQKLLREVRKRWPENGASTNPARTEYQKWFEGQKVTTEGAAAMRAEANDFVYQPCVSIITPVFNTPLPWLEEAISSVLAQAYEKWELILIDDGSTDPALVAFLASLPARDSRIIVTKATQRRGISAASNRGLELATGDWVGFLDHDDVLEPDAVFQHVKWLQDHPDSDLLYSDEDKLTEDGLDAPIFKPDWSPDFFLSCNYVCHFTLIRRKVLGEVGGFRSEFDGAQDYDLFFRVVERSSRIHHIPRVLYHWRRSEASTADNIRRKPKSLETGRLAVESHLKRTGTAGHVAVDWRTHAYWVKRDLREAKKISIIIPVRDQIGLLARCLESLTSRTTYEPYEIVVVDNDSQSDEAREYFANFKHRRLEYKGPFNFSAINNFAVQQTDSPWFLFLNNDTEVIDGSWLTTMAEHVQRPEVGAVGPRLLYPDDTVQHAGIVVGVGGIAEHAFRGFPAESPGVCRQLQATRNYSAVTGACLLTRRDVFDEVGGFDEERLPVTFNDVDLCLKMRRAGYLVVYTPFAKLYHHESASRRRSIEPMETNVMQERWAEILANDPYYNPNLSRERADFSLGH
ncbi:MAG: glycosyltransferase [Verrucomicrobiota bacterium]|nr:glycosyltransferase [Verrucomicrobiota bacterium]